jgi:enterochelin esterase-like enzyme
LLTRVRTQKPKYQLVTEWVESVALAGNPAAVDSLRPVTVFIPGVAEDQAQRRFPVLYCLAPWTSAGRQQMDWEPFKESLPDRLQRLMDAGALKPCIVVCPDLYTAFGGSQYINSSYLGAHADHIVQEVIPFIEAHYPVLPGAASRAVFGRSSGGFGALRLAFDSPGTFAALACHSGDMGFDLLYRRDLVDLCYALARHSGSVPAYLQALRKGTKIAGKDIHILMLLGMAASYSPDLNRAEGFRLPIDPITGAIDEAIWQQWMAHDPVQIIEQSAGQEALQQLKYLYLDCGNKDQYHLHFGMRQFKRKLEGKGIHHQIFEFDDNHSGTSYRYDVSLPLLSQALVHEG